MSWSRIKALVQQDLYMTKREPNLWADLFFFSTINVLLFGFIAEYFAGSNQESALYLLSGVLLWEIIRLAQYTVTVTSLWNLWSHNLSNLFIAPISVAEYVAGNVLTATVKTFATFIPLVVVVSLAFDFNLLSVGLLVVILAFVDLILFACALGLILLGLIFRFGIRVQALAWSAVYLFQPLVGVFYTLDVLPRPFQILAQCVPATHVFIGVRNSIDGIGPVYWPLFVGGVTGLVFFAMAYGAFAWMHRRSMVVGQFARNDS